MEFGGSLFLWKGAGAQAQQRYVKPRVFAMFSQL